MPIDSATWHCGSGTQWTIEPDGIVLWNVEKRMRLPLYYPQAAVWDFFSRGDSYERVIRKVAAIAWLDSGAVERLVRESLSQWTEAGFLVSEVGHG